MVRLVTFLTATCIAGLVAVLPAEAKTPPPAAVAKVGLDVAKLGLAAAAVQACTSKACVPKSYSSFYVQAHTLDGALKALWEAAGESGPCAAAVANAGAGFDSLTGSYRSLEAATLQNDKAAAKKAFAQIEATTPRVVAIVSSFKTKCR